jgi:hypothetical protein
MQGLWGLQDAFFENYPAFAKAWGKQGTNILES